MGKNSKTSGEVVTKFASVNSILSMILVLFFVKSENGLFFDGPSGPALYFLMGLHRSKLRKTGRDQTFWRLMERSP